MEWREIINDGWATGWGILVSSTPVVCQLSGREGSAFVGSCGMGLEIGDWGWGRQRCRVRRVSIVTTYVRTYVLIKVVILFVGSMKSR